MFVAISITTKPVEAKAIRSSATPSCARLADNGLVGFVRASYNIIIIDFVLSPVEEILLFSNVLFGYAAVARTLCMARASDDATVTLNLIPFDTFFRSVFYN